MNSTLGGSACRYRGSLLGKSYPWVSLKMSPMWLLSQRLQILPQSKLDWPQMVENPVFLQISTFQYILVHQAKDVLKSHLKRSHLLSHLGPNGSTPGHNLISLYWVLREWRVQESTPIISTLLITRDDSLAPKWVRLAPNGTNRSFFRSDFSTFGSVDCCYTWRFHLHVSGLWVGHTASLT